MVKASDFKFGQHDAPTQCNGWRKLQFLIMSFDDKIMVFRVHEIEYVWKTPFCKSGQK